jgi:hypothetical protein
MKIIVETGIFCRHELPRAFHHVTIHLDPDEGRP